MSVAIRRPAVAGSFYDADPAALSRSVADLLSRHEPASRLPAGSWRALMLPHAGYVYSGAIAAAGVAAVEWPRLVILLGPNHRGVGSAAALSPARSWQTPLGEVPRNQRLIDALLATKGIVTSDAHAHEHEHSLEVLLPFLQAARPDVEIACLALAHPSLELCRSVGEAVASAVKAVEESTGERVAIVVSSDLNHYLPRRENRLKDEQALAALFSGSPGELFETVYEREDITMCGILPATALLFALGSLEPVRPVRVAYGDSADFSGDELRVVGYASVLWVENASSVAPEREG